MLFLCAFPALRLPLLVRVQPRGTAYYRTAISLPAGVPGLLYFAACSFYCNVLVDGDSIGDHRAGGYTPFWLTVPASDRTTRDLVVVVDNRWNSTTAPTHTGGDFYMFGGITRSVVLHHQVSSFRFTAGRFCNIRSSSILHCIIAVPGS